MGSAASKKKQRPSKDANDKSSGGRSGFCQGEKATNVTHSSTSSPPSKKDPDQRKSFNDDSKVNNKHPHQELSSKKKTKLDSNSQESSSHLMKRLLKGDLSVQCPSTFKSVRIFVSSTFTDTQHERNWLMEKVYPRLKEYCRSQGYDFQVVDMRWGIRDVALDDHTTTEICLQEVDLCKTQPTGPCFLSLMSHKYGYRDFPRKIPTAEFDKLLDEILEEDAKSEISIWFKKDENEVPSKYILQPISSGIPKVKSEEADVRREALAEWNAIKLKMHTALASAALKVLSDKAAQMYTRSVSEAETMNCLQDVPKENVIWYRRIIHDIDSVDANNEGMILRRFKDLANDPIRDEESKQLLKQLQEEKMGTQLSQSNIKVYEVNWEPGKGIDPDKNESHCQYLNQLCTDAEKQMTSLIQSAFHCREQREEGNPLFNEVLQHTHFCQEKCKAFHGRSESLKKLEQYLQGPSDAPFVVHGPSGCGKTSLMAMTVKMAEKILGSKVTTVFRFLGTTPDSSNLPNLLKSLIKQIKLAAGLEIPDLSVMDFKQLVVTFKTTMTMTDPRMSEPLLLVLDSLDQLDTSNEARQMLWLDGKLAKNVKVVLSTLPEEHYSILPILQDKLKDHPSNFLNVPSLSDTDIVSILDKWLETERRTLTASQRECMISSFHKCPLPLYLKLSFDQACQWKSYQPQEQTVLQPTVRGLIDEMFNRMEEFHGKVFVSRALGYLTASQTGLSEPELEDILSCDEEVLDDVYRFWTPPLRRLPPFLLIRMKRDLGQYIVHRGTDGNLVFHWYHRQFIEASRDRYCSDPNEVKRLHQGLAEFFAGTWAEGKAKPFLDKNKVEGFADRYVASQQMKFGSELNQRKLHRQPYHRAMAGQLELLKSECLINYKFLTTKLELPGGLQLLLDDFRLARNIFPDDKELTGVSEALQLSQHALSYDLRTFPSQMIGRIRSSKIQSLPLVSKFLMECQDADHTYLQPDRPVLVPSGGELVHTIAEETDGAFIQSLTLNKTGTIAITCNENGCLRTFDVKKGKLLKSLEGVGTYKASVKLACSDSMIVINGEDGIAAYDIVNGSQRWILKTDSSSHFVVGGKDNSTLLVTSERKYRFYKADNCQPTDDNGWMEFSPGDGPVKPVFSECGPSVGGSAYAVTCDSRRNYAFLFDFKSLSLLKHDKLLKPDEDHEKEREPIKIELMEMSTDGETFCVTEDYDEFFYIIRTKTLEIFRVFKAGKPFSLDTFHFSLDWNYLYFPDHNSVKVWEISTGKRATLFNRLSSNPIRYVVSSDMDTFVATYSDRCMRIFNVSRGDQPELTFGDADSEGTEVEEWNVVACQQTDIPHLFLVVWEVNERSLKEQILALFNASTSSILKRYHHDFQDSNEGRMTSIRYVKDWRVLVQTKRRIRILDLTTMAFITTFNAVLPYYCNDVIFVNGGKEIAIVSKENNNLKIMDCTTGEENGQLEADHNQRIWKIITNEKGTILIAGCEGPFLVYDIMKRTKLFSISTEDSKCSETKYQLEDAVLTSDGAYLIFLAQYETINKGKGEKTDVSSIHVFNMQRRRHDHELKDDEHAKFHGKSPLGYRFFKVLDEAKLISSHKDFIVRIFNFRTGTLLQRLEGHKSVVQFSYTFGSRFLITHRVEGIDNAARLWDTTNFDCVAVFSYDHDMCEFHVVESEACTVFSFLQSEMTPVLLSLRGKGSEKFTLAPSPQKENIKCPDFDLDGDAKLGLGEKQVYLYHDIDDVMTVRQTWDDDASVASFGTGSDFDDYDDRRSMSR